METGGRRGYMAAMKDNGLLARCAYAALACSLLANLWAEGSANLVGDFTKIKQPGGFSKGQQEQYARNEQRSRQNFALFESLLFSHRILSGIPGYLHAVSRQKYH